MWVSSELWIISYALCTSYSQYSAKYSDYILESVRQMRKFFELLHLLQWNRNTRDVRQLMFLQIIFISKSVSLDENALKLTSQFDFITINLCQTIITRRLSFYTYDAMIHLELLNLESECVRNENQFQGWSAIIEKNQHISGEYWTFKVLDNNLWKPNVSVPVSYVKLLTSLVWVSDWSNSLMCTREMTRCFFPHLFCLERHGTVEHTRTHISKSITCKWKRLALHTIINWPKPRPPRRIWQNLLQTSICLSDSLKWIIGIAAVIDGARSDEWIAQSTRVALTATLPNHWTHSFICIYVLRG